MSRILEYVLVIAFTLFTCTRSDYNSKLSKYLKAEKELRSRIGEEQGLSDSIRSLQQRYRIDLEEEYSQLGDDPESWIKLFKELKN